MTADLKVSLNLNWEQKLLALQSIADVSLRMRKPGDWYSSVHSVDIAGDGFLSGRCGNGDTPQEAVEDQWRILVDDLPENKYLRVHRYSSDKPRYVRWNGFMWIDVPRTINGNIVPEEKGY